MMAIVNRNNPMNSPIALYQTNKQLNGLKFNHVLRNKYTMRLKRKHTMNIRSAVPNIRLGPA